MALKGSLKDFPIADVFQLIGQQQKSGFLMIHNEAKTLRLVFYRGQIALGNALGEDRLLLGYMLRAAGLLDESDLNKALEEQKLSKRSLGDILLKHQLLTVNNFKTFMSLQLDEILFELFRWDDGQYEFVSQDINLKTDFFNLQRPEGALMEQFRRKDEWPGIIQRIGSEKNFFQAVASENVNFEAVGHPHAQDIYALLAQPLSIETLGFRSRLGVFEAALAVTKLLEANLVTSKAMEVDAEVREIWFLPRTAVFIFAVALGFAALFFSPHSHFFVRKATPYSDQGRAISPEAPMQALSWQNTENQLRFLLESHWLEKGFYPRSLESIGLSKTQGARWHYVPTTRNFELYRKEH